jgi:hypothetical protein
MGTNPLGLASSELIPTKEKSPFQITHLVSRVEFSLQTQIRRV